MKEFKIYADIRIRAYDVPVIVMAETAEEAESLLDAQGAENFEIDHEYILNMGSYDTDRTDTETEECVVAELNKGEKQ